MRVLHICSINNNCNKKTSSQYVNLKGEYIVNSVVNKYLYIILKVDTEGSKKKVWIAAKF
jgi:hypothetical protein